MKINKISPQGNSFLKSGIDIAYFPKSLYFVGNLPSKRLPAVAIVGPRKITPYGKDVTYRLAYDLAKRGVVIVSGLALGIDGAAHQAALDAGGITIAVMAGGLDSIHPASHRNLAKNIIQNRGALISEYPPGSVPYRPNFIARNRIVSAISDGLLVIEAAAKSGTMHTANFALEQGKPVMAVPGNITSPMSEGCNNLINTGARLITEAKDVLDEIGYNPENTQASLPLGENASQQAVLNLMASGLRDGVELQTKSGLEAAEFSRAITMLEITGVIRALGANRWGIK